MPPILDAYQPIGSIADLCEMQATTTPFITTASHLLQLPLELRLVIYTHVLGNQTIHIQGKSTNYDSYEAHLCVSETFNAAQCQDHRLKSMYDSRILTKKTWHRLLSNAARDNEDYVVSDPWLPHYGCESKENTARLDLALLSTCKQIYDEAALIPYNSNTFVFNDYRNFSKFFEVPIIDTSLHTVTVPSWNPAEEYADKQQSLVACIQLNSKKNAIRNLRIHASYVTLSDIYLWDSVCEQAASHLPDIRGLEICIDLRFQDSSDMAYLESEMFSRSRDDGRDMVGFRTLAGSPSKRHVTVDVTDPLFGIYLYDAKFRVQQGLYRWTAWEKQKLAAKIEGALLEQAKRSWTDNFADCDWTLPPKESVATSVIEVSD